MSAPSPGFARPPEGVQENLGTARRFLISLASWPDTDRPTHLARPLRTDSSGAVHDMTEREYLCG